MNSLAARGFADCISVVAGDMFADSLPEGFDLHLFSNQRRQNRPLARRRLLRASHDPHRGKCYSEKEMADCSQQVGFCDNKHIPTAADRSLITARKN